MCRRISALATCVNVAVPMAFLAVVKRPLTLLNVHWHTTALAQRHQISATAGGDTAGTP